MFYIAQYRDDHELVTYDVTTVGWRPETRVAHRPRTCGTP